MSDEAWIEQSLARLEELETHKAQLETYGGDSETVAELEAEISALYQTLNDAAGEGQATKNQSWSEPPVDSASSSFADEADDADDDDAVWVSAAASVGHSASPASIEHPLAAPPLSAPSDPFASSGSSFGADDSGSFATASSFESSSYADFDDSDTESSKSKLPWIAAAAALVIAVGVGGFFATKKDSAPAPAPTAAGEPKIITASAVPEDTQEPDAAKGAAVDRTEGTVYKESHQPQPKSRPDRRSSGSKKSRRSGGSKSKADDGRRVSGAASNDPLAGL